MGIGSRSLRSSNWPHASASYGDTSDLRLNRETCPACIRMLQIYDSSIHLFILCTMMFQDKTVASSQITMLFTPQLISPALANHLQDCRKTSLSLVSAHIVENRTSLLKLFFTAHGISGVSSILRRLFLTFQPIFYYFCRLQSLSGSEGLVVATLTLILYTINLHITASVGVSHVRLFKSVVHAQVPKTTAARNSNSWNFACNPNGRNSRSNISGVGFCSKITNCGCFYHHILFPSYDDWDFSIPPYAVHEGNDRPAPDDSP
jgi:hypothetical protein